MNSIMEQNEKSYLCATCDFCKKDMIVAEGSVIIGIKWYHPACFVQADLDVNKIVLGHDQSIQHNANNTKMQKIPNPSNGDTN